MEKEIIKLADFFFSILSRKSVELEFDAVLKQLLKTLRIVVSADCTTIVFWESGIGVIRLSENFPKNTRINGLLIEKENNGIDNLLYYKYTEMLQTESEQSDFEIPMPFFLGHYSKNVDADERLKKFEFNFAAGFPIIKEKKVNSTIAFYWYEKPELSREEIKKILMKYYKFTAMTIYYFQVLQENYEMKITIKKKEGFIKDILQNIPLALIEIDIGGRVLLWNNYCEKITGILSKEIENLKIPIQKETPYEQQFQRALKQVLKEKQPTQIHLYLQTQKETDVKNEKKGISLEAHLIPRKQEKEINSILIMAEDKSEEEKLKEQLEAVKKKYTDTLAQLHATQQKAEHLKKNVNMLEEMKFLKEISNRIGNNIRNPLMGITSAIHLINEVLSEQELIKCDKTTQISSALKTIHENIENIEFASKKIETTINALMDFSEIIEEVHFRTTNIYDVIKQTLQFFTNISLKELKNDKKTEEVNSDISISFHEPRNKNKSIFAIRGNFQLLRRTLLMLLENAYIAVLLKKRSKKSKKEIHISLCLEKEEEARRIVLKIKDTGIGINNTIKKQIFTPFLVGWPLKKEDPKASKHVGLSLFMVKVSLNKLRGDIFFSSTPGKGTTFTLKFPLEEENKEVEKG